MKKQLGFYMDQSRCSGCNACAMACKDTNNLDDSRLFRRVTEHKGGGFSPSGKSFANNVWAFWVSMSCNHCDAPKCVDNCPTGAMHKREEDGVVVVDQDRCVGCRYCLWSCPYNAPHFDEAKGKMSKCDMCLDLRTKGADPACVGACPLELLKCGPIAELRATYGSLAEIRGLPEASLTRPNVVIKPHKSAAGKD